MQAGLQGAALGRLQGRAGILEAARQRRIAHRAAQLHLLVLAHGEALHGQAVAQVTGDPFQIRLVLVAQQGQEAVVVEPGQRRRCHGARQAGAGLGHQAFEGGIAVAFAQAQGTGDLDEEQAAAGAVGQRLVDLLQQPAAGGQAGVGMVAHHVLARAGLTPLGAGALDPVGDRRDQVARPDRLGQEVVGAAFEHFELAFRIRIAGEKHDRQQLERRLLADQCGQAHAILAGHVQVHQDQVRVEAGDRVDHPVRLHLHLGLHPGPVQHALGEQGLGAVVLHDQHAVGRVVAAAVRPDGRGRAAAGCGGAR